MENENENVNDNKMTIKFKTEIKPSVLSPKGVSYIASIFTVKWSVFFNVKENGIFGSEFSFEEISGYLEDEFTGHEVEFRMNGETDFCNMVIDMEGPHIDDLTIDLVRNEVLVS